MLFIFVEMKTRIPLTVFPIEQDGYHIKLKVWINDQPAVFILDTGASKTVMDKNIVDNFMENPEMTLLEQLTSGIGTNTMESHMVMIKKIKIGRIMIEDFPCAVLDLHHVNTAYDHLQLEKIMGVLGGDILNKYNAVINYEKKFLTLSEN